MRRSIDTIRMRQLLSLHVRYKAVIPNKKYLNVLDEFWALMTIDVAARLPRVELTCHIRHKVGFKHRPITKYVQALNAYLTVRFRPGFCFSKLHLWIQPLFSRSERGADILTPRSGCKVKQVIYRQNIGSACMWSETEPPRSCLLGSILQPVGVHTWSSWISSWISVFFCHCRLYLHLPVKYSPQTCHPRKRTVILLFRVFLSLFKA